VTASELDRRIRDLRPPKARFDPYTAHGSVVEEERRPGGNVERSLTAFLVGAECPFTCAFCDLWQWTIDGPTIPGALTSQLRAVLAAHSSQQPDRIKVYNASNFFDARSVPAEDVNGIAELTAGFAGVTVESHASMVGHKAIDFARRLRGRLEVAVGLETVNPAAAAQLNKKLDIARFDSAAELLVENGIDLRVFVLLGTPYLPVEESVEWTVRTVGHAIDRGASVVSIIPVRGGNGELERLGSQGDFVAPTLLQLENALDACSHFESAVVTGDLWDVEGLPACAHCQPERVARLRRINVTGTAEPRITCEACHA
jgi:radical SAM enzyme (TIGR01210 family)